MQFSRHVGLCGIIAFAGVGGGCQLISGLDDLAVHKGSGGGSAQSSSSGQSSASSSSGGGSSTCTVPPCVETLQITAAEVHRVAVSVQHLYWLEGEVGTKAGIFRVPLTALTASPEPVVSPRPILRFAVDLAGAHVVWSETESAAGVYVISAFNLGAEYALLDGGQGYGFSDVAAATSYGFWYEAGKNQVQRLQFGTQAPAVVGMLSDPMHGDGFTTYAPLDRVYWIDSQGIQVVEGLNPVKVAVGSGAELAENLFGLAADSIYFYWTAGTDKGTVNAYPIDGSVSGATTTMPNQLYPRHIISSGTRLYWFNGQDAACAGSVLEHTALPLTAASVAEALPGTYVCPSNLAQDGAHIYWAAGNAIYRMKYL